MCKPSFIPLFTFLLLKCLSGNQASRIFDVNGIETILALENETISIECKTDMPMAYCGFVHPNGSRYSFSDSTLNAGHCAVKINASKRDEGQWRCHIGTAAPGKIATGVEIMQKIQVRVVGQIAAIRQNITAVHGKPVTIVCATTKRMTPLRYCRFEPPDTNKFKHFGIDSEITEKNAILSRFYFPKNKSTDRGDCAVTIKSVKYDDNGLWTCGAGLDDGKEHIDFISLEVEGFYTISTASVTGITFGAIGIAAVLVILGFVTWKRRSFLGSGRREAPPPAEEHELRHLEGSPPRSPRSGRHVPLVTVQSPSEASASPALA